MKVFHLSHIDLDGYGCQFISQKFFKDISFYNANYGKEVSARLNTILNIIKEQVALESKFRTKNQSEFLILITDLNLTQSEAKFINNEITELKIKGVNINLLLLDHHISGLECSKTYEWYILDSTRCATKITYEYLMDKYKNKENEKYKDMVEMINSVDIWKEDGFGFEFGKVALGLISDSNELNRFMFDKEHREYKLKLLDSSIGFLGQDKGEVKFDNEIFRIKKLALGGDPDNETMEFITARIQAKLLGKNKQNCTIRFSNKTGFLSYSMGGISVLANLFLRENSEIDFYIDINHRGNVSLRANGNCDVSELAKIAFNGGGHKNASGGKMEGFRESFFYEDIKSQVQAHLDSKEVNNE